MKTLLISCIVLLMTLMLVSGQGCPSNGTSRTGNDTGNGGTQSSAAAQVDIQNFAFVPGTVTIQAGQTVRWINHDANAHTITSGNPGDADAGAQFDQTINVGATYDHTFTAPGTYIYFCRFHSATMRDAKVIVTPVSGQ